VARRRSRLLAALVAALLLWWLAARFDRPPVPPGRWLVAAGLEPREADVGGRRIRYVRAGAGSPVLLVHGFASSLYTWKDVLPGLARDHDVVALDLPGFGWSEQPPDLSFADFPAAVLGLMDALGLDRAALVGNSLGGAAVAAVAARDPTRVSALVLVDSVGFNLDPKDQPAILRFVMSPAGRVLGVLPLRRAAVTLALRQVFHDPALVTDERVAEYLAPLQRPGALDSIRSLGRSAAPTVEELVRELGRVRAPALVIWGRDDRWIPLADADRFVAAIPRATKLVLDDCGHVPQEEKPGEVTQALLRFLATSAPG
jgi:pimeloyl-ACP methyl ester carboxylesterase